MTNKITKNQARKKYKLQYDEFDLIPNATGGDPIWWYSESDIVATMPKIKEHRKQKREQSIIYKQIDGVWYLFGRTELLEGKEGQTVKVTKKFGVTTEEKILEVIPHGKINSLAKIEQYTAPEPELIIPEEFTWQNRDGDWYIRGTPELANQCRHVSYSYDFTIRRTAIEIPVRLASGEIRYQWAEFSHPLKHRAIHGYDDYRITWYRPLTKVMMKKLMAHIDSLQKKRDLEFYVNNYIH